MEIGLMALVFGAIKTIFKVLLKIFVFTGLWLFVLIGAGIDFGLRPLVAPGFTKIAYPTQYGIYEIITIVIAAIPALSILIRNVVRLVSRTPDFSLWKWILGIDRDKIKASRELMKELSQTSPIGFVFGRRARHWVTKPPETDGHILIIGGAGSGKSSCLVIPSLMAWPQRFFAIDIKGELTAETSRKRPNHKVFNPLSASSPGYDPYYLLARSRNPAQDAREIAHAIAPRPADVREPFWIEGAQNILTGAILHFHNLGYSFLDTVLAVQSTPVEQLITEIHGSDTIEARLFVNQLVGMDMKTLAGIYAELSNKIMVFATDPDIRGCLTRESTITPNDLENGFDLYITVPEDKIEQWKGLLTLIVNQFMKHFERRPDKDATPVLFLLEEFARLGKVETAVNGLATLRSKRVTICIVAQSLAQLDAIYGKENRRIIADNCQYKAILNATDADTQDYFSRLVGTFDKRKKSQSANFEQYTGMGTGTGTSRTTEERRIIKPEEFATLKDLVLLTPYGFCRVEKTPYYKTRTFQI